MRRIDLTCKLIGPLFIALIDGVSTEAAILVNLGMNIASVAIEYFAIAQVSRTTGIFSLLDVILKLPRSITRCQNYNNLRQHHETNRLAERNIGVTLYTAGGTSARSYRKVYMILVSTSIIQLSYRHSPALYCT